MVATLPDTGLVPYIERELSHRWQCADHSQRRRGRQWYTTARELMVELAAETGYTLEQAVGVLAITSAGAQLATNLRWTREALESRGAAKVGRFPNVMGPKIAAVLADPVYAGEYVRGPKVGPFFRAILGDNALVLDRWAIFAAAPLATSDRDEADSLTAGARAAIVAAYTSAARRVRCTVRDFQAVVWLQTRESTPVTRKGKTYIPRLADITAA